MSPLARSRPGRGGGWRRGDGRRSTHGRLGRRRRAPRRVSWPRIARHGAARRRDASKPLATARRPKEGRSVRGEDALGQLLPRSAAQCRTVEADLPCERRRFRPNRGSRPRLARSRPSPARKTCGDPDRPASEPRSRPHAAPSPRRRESCADNRAARPCPAVPSRAPADGSGRDPPAYRPGARPDRPVARPPDRARRRRRSRARAAGRSRRQT